ncbi:MAG: hypothetical protein KGJ06_03540 [Pseudomonadota bacterium]|nr:hypothetical protein [Pseudomonadota bacterium]
MENPAAFPNPLPERLRESISRDAIERLAVRITPNAAEAEESAKNAKLGQLVLALTQPSYDTPQEYLVALNAYNDGQPAIASQTDSFGEEGTRYLQEGKRLAQKLLAREGIYASDDGKTWTATLSRASGRNR